MKTKKRKPGKAVAVRKPQAVAVLPPPTSILELLDRAARDPMVNVEKMTQLVALKERLDANAAKVAYATAMRAAQAEIKTILKRGENKSTGSWYSTYEDLMLTVGPVAERNGFSIAFDTDDPPKSEIPMVRVVAHVTHIAGHTETYKLDLPADGKGAKGGDVMTRTHATGSAITYGRRYLVKMIFNVVDSDLVDDDGNAAGTAYIDEGKAGDLRAMATELGVNIPAYLAAIKVTDFEKIPVSRYATAVATLEAKRRAT